MLVRKKNGEIRFCLDFRKLNAVTVRPIFHLPDIKEIFDNLGQSNFFSSIDISSAFHQMPVSEMDKSKTAFATTRGQYEFNRLPFGLCGATASFQRLMYEILRDENWDKCLIYVDDVIIIGKNFDEHLQNLSLVLSKLLSAGIKISPSKCKLFKTKMSFLGHMISRNGIEADPEKCKVIKEMKRPKTKEEVRSFLGLCNYYRRFILKYASITAPIEDMCNATKSDKSEVEWSHAALESIETLKTKLSSPPILRYPRREGKFILDTDAYFK